MKPVIAAICFAGMSLASFAGVTESPKIIEPRRVTVGGMVRDPGMIDFVEGMNLWTAVQNVGGVNEFAALKNVTLYRDGKKIQCDLTAENGRNTPLRPADTIDIGQKTVCGE